MRALGAVLGLALIAGGAGAQIVPLGAPVIPPDKTKAAQAPAAQDLSGRMHATRPLGSNYSPYSIQPQGGVPIAAPSSLPGEKPVASGVVTDPNALSDDGKKAAKPTKEQSDMQKLAPQGLERTELPKADAEVPK